MSRKSILDVLNTFAAIATVLGIIFAAWSYLGVENDNRISATLGYVARFNSDPISSAFKEEYQTYETKGQAIQHGDVDSKELTKLQVNFVLENHLEWDAILLGDFFDQTYICVKQNICDLDLTATMLGRDIETTYVNNGRYLQDLRAKGDALTGCGLDALYNSIEPRLDYSRLSREDKAGNVMPSLRISRDACPSI